MSHASKLLPIPRKYWPQLRHLFKGNYLETEKPFNAVQNYIEWTRIDPKIRHLEFALELIDWDFPYRIFAILDRHQEVLKRMLKKLNVPYPKATVACNLYRLCNENTLLLGNTISPPKGFRLGTLEVHHVRTINETWSFRSGGSEYALTRCVAWNINVGLFNERDELVSWCLLNNLGIICVLYTVENYRRQGFAELVLRSMVIKLAKRGMKGISSVLLGNSTSRALFEKLGFQGDLIVHDSCHQVDRLVEWNFF